MIGARAFNEKIETERLVLAYPRAGDYAPWARLRRASREHLEPFEPAWPSDALSRDDWRRRLRTWRESQRAGSAHVFLAWRRRGRALTGGVALNNVRYGSVRSASVGYWLGEAHTGEGLMSEALEAVCRWAFDGLGLERLEAAILPGNNASIGVIQRVGFREEGAARSYLEIAGRRRDHLLFGLVRTDLPV